MFCEKFKYALIFLRPLNQQYFDLLKSKIELGLVESSQATAGGEEKIISSKKNTIKDVQEKVKMFLINSKLFEKSVKFFDGMVKKFMFINFFISLSIFSVLHVIFKLLFMNVLSS